MRSLLWLIIAFAPAIRAADPPRDVVDFFSAVTRALADAHTEDSRLPNDAADFLAKFDSKMAGYAQLRVEIEDLVSRSPVGAAVEFVTDEGNEDKRTLDLDWTLEIENQRPRRQVLKCTIERSGNKGKWKITALTPVEFFKY